MSWNSERVLRFSVTVPAAVDDIWAAWTTEAGVRGGPGRLDRPVTGC
jgi:uncharacterized protein YndB with AHSA1/START domain